jgi:predicted GNAT superfamily acetyltransferase
MSDVIVRELRVLAEMDALRATAARVWGGSSADMVSSDFLMALAHAGGYVAGALEDDEMVGCSFGILAKHGHEWCLHSHITGIVPEWQNSGLGARMKFHQRDWARVKELRAITWTFDPLVRRNGWFNLERLGARAIEYHVDFYGALNDDINGSGETDRLLAWWDVETSSARIVVPSDPIVVPTPDDIVALRRHDPTAAHQWRLSMRDRLGPLLTTHDVVGMNDNGDYLLERKESR